MYPDELHDELVTMTQDTMDGATLWTQNSGAQRDFTNLKCHWYTLAAVDLLCAGEHRRKLQVCAMDEKYAIIASILSGFWW